MDRSVKKLPDGELEVMQAVWACTPPVARSSIEENLKDSHPMALTTLLTQLSRLTDKGFLFIEKTGRTAKYIPVISREEYLASQSNRFIQKLCKGDLSVFANALCDSGLTREELAQLRTLLEKR